MRLIYKVQRKKLAEFVSLTEAKSAFDLSDKAYMATCRMASQKSGALLVSELLWNIKTGKAKL
jgi:hypothetical protein